MRLSVHALVDLLPQIAGQSHPTFERALIERAMALIGCSDPDKNTTTTNHDNKPEVLIGKPYRRSQRRNTPGVPLGQRTSPRRGGSRIAVYFGIGWGRIGMD